MKRSELRADPDAIRAWQQRSREKRKRRQKISDKTRRDVYARSRRKCIVCRRRVRLEIHHVLPVRLYAALETEPTNLVGICAVCHERHENASRRIRWEELPACAVLLAYASGGAEAAYIERTYPRRAVGSSLPITD